MKKILYTVWDIVEVFVIAVIAVVVIKQFLIQPFIVIGASMESNFYDGDYLIVDELSYRFKEPERGDVVVFHSPQNPSNYFIKRVIGLPGETVKIDNNNVVIYNDENQNGFNLDEEYTKNNNGREWDGYVNITLDENKYFVLGDNRLNSLDSRYWGALDKDKIVGVVKLRLWPLSEMTFFESPKYSFAN